ncbi:MAG: hypothetical protein ACP6IY_18840 [Promethearchaeia archaeon]
MSLENLWKIFHELFSECLNSKIESHETLYFSGRFWSILWRLKDDISGIHKLALNLQEIFNEFYLINSYKSILAIQALAISQFYSKKLFNRVFKNFITLVESNETYVKHIIYKNQLDSNALWIIENGPNIFPNITNLLKECEEIWNKLKNPKVFDEFSEDDAYKKSQIFYNYFGAVAQFAEGIEGYIDRLFEGSKRDEPPQDYLDLSEFNINLKELKDQIQNVNELYKYHFFDTIPFKIRLILEYMIRKLVKWKNPTTKSKNFKGYIIEFEKLFRNNKSNSFLAKSDIERLDNLREWGNLTAHDIFPAISKEELDDKKNSIIRLIKNLININKDQF